MPSQDLHATQAYHAEEVLDVVLPADDQPTKLMQPSKESFPFPTPAVPPQRATVQCGFATLSAMECDHLDAIALGQISIQAVTIVGLVADQSWGRYRGSCARGGFRRVGSHAAKPFRY